jgi:ribosomal protein S12 methylthiotransferase
MKIGMMSLGCAKNQVDAERILFKLKEAGYEIASDPALSDIVIINTCGFIESAKQESIDTIFEFAELKNEGRIKKIVITGCLSERYKEEAAELIPEADAVLGIGRNADIVEILKRVSEGERVCEYGKKTDLPLTGGRAVPMFSSYLKIADGCDNRCSYCSIPLIRGNFRSVPMEDLLKEAEFLAKNGVAELNVIAQDTTRYGSDLYGAPKLNELLEKLCEIDGIRWIRILYCYPDGITDELLELIAKSDKIVKYIDLPIQHCNKEILKAMNRRGDRASLSALIKKIRDKIPGVVIRTTFITGFPGETEEQFEELAQFAAETEFDRLGCFAYSKEEETKAAELSGQIDEETKSRRADIIMENQILISEKKTKASIGRTLDVLIEGYDRLGECWFGRSEYDAPEVDGKVFIMKDGIKDKKPVPGEFLRVKITDAMDYDLIGEIIYEPAE